MRCNGDFRFAALVAFAERAGADAALDGPLRAHRRARRAAARRARRRPGQGPVVHARDDRSAAARPRRLPARERDEGSDAAPRPPPPGSPPRTGAESQEACFLAGDDYRTFLERQGVAPTARADRRRGRRGARPPRRRLALHARPAARARRSRRREPLYALRADAATNTLVVGPRALARDARRVEARGTALRAVERAEAKLRYRSAAVAASRRGRPADGFALELDEPVDAVAPGQVAVLYDDDAVVGAGVITARRGRIPRDAARALRR